MSNANPYPVGSDDWHRFNLGVSKNIIGQMIEVKIDEYGAVVEFLLYDDDTFRVDDEYICELGEDCPFREDLR